MENLNIKDLEKLFDTADLDAGKIMKRDLSGK